MHPLFNRPSLLLQPLPLSKRKEQGQQFLEASKARAKKSSSPTKASDGPGSPPSNNVIAGVSPRSWVGLRCDAIPLSASGHVSSLAEATGDWI